MDNIGVQEALSRINDLPTLPAVLGKILDIAFDPGASAAELSTHIAHDQSLSARMLKIVNSPYYGFHRQVSDLTSAVVILGFAEIRNMVLTASAFSTLPTSDSGYDRSRLWAHSIATAIATEECAKKLNVESEGCFITGLLHDIGRVALDTVFPEEFTHAVQMASQKQVYLREAESEIFNLDHAAAGGFLAEHWNFPATIVEAIRYHHMPDKPTLDPQLTSLTAMGDFISHKAGFGESFCYRAPQFPAAAIECLEISEELWTDVAEQVVSSKDRIDAILGVLLSA